MNIQLQGLLFKARSPSDLELVSVRRDVDPDATVRIRFVGDRWVIHYQSPYANVVRGFPTRDAAVQMIASRAP